jgi:hypothetical protein
MPLYHEFDIILSPNLASSVAVVPADEDDITLKVPSSTLKLVTANFFATKLFTSI